MPKRYGRPMIDRNDFLLRRLHTSTIPLQFYFSFNDIQHSPTQHNIHEVFSSNDLFCYRHFRIFWSNSDNYYGPSSEPRWCKSLTEVTFYLSFCRSYSLWRRNNKNDVRFQTCKNFLLTDHFDCGKGKLSRHFFWNAHGYVW